MAGVFKEIKLTWQGVEYRLTPSMALLRRIDGEVNIMSMIQKASGDQFPVFDLAYVVCEFLREAGAKVSDDEIYRDMLDDMGSNEGAETVPMLEAVIQSISPGDESSKKPASLAAAPKKARQPRRK